MSTPISVRGDVDQRAVDQLQRCADAGNATSGVLCADGHVGYSQPIGGAVAYPDHISPSGVGYDIACIAAGTPVTTSDGYTLPVEAVSPGTPATCWDGRTVRVATPVDGTVARGHRPTVRLLFRNGRELRCTADHEIRTPLGWRAAGDLAVGDRTAQLPFVGLPHAATIRDAAEMRLLGVLCGDGHLSRDGKAVSWHTVVPEDAASIADDAERLGLRARIYVRERGPNRRPEHCVRVASKSAHQRFAALGCPIGRKVDGWASDALRWLLDEPAWVQAQFISGFASAEATTPVIRGAAIPNLTIKQAGIDRTAIDLLAALLASLGFRTGISVSDRREDVTTWALQILGGTEEQLRFITEVGFCHAVEKRRAAAEVASVAWQAAVTRDRRAAAIDEAHRLRATGLTVAAAKSAVATAYAVSPSLVHHGLYGRGVPRLGASVPEHDTSGEVVWVEVAAIEDDGVAPVFDVVTGDAAQAFQAAGVCVHNCGNKAVRTALRTEDVRADLPRIMDSVFERISFGVGRRNDEPVDHEVIDRIGAADFAPQRQLKDLAAKQLGTVGAGNHYVDLFDGDDGHVWIGVHFGSRGFGHKTASGFLALAEGKRFEDRGTDGEMDSPPVLLHVGSDLGQAYIAAMELAGEYAYAGRDVVVDRVLDILGTTAAYAVHNHHNFGFRESHGGVDVWVIRKGCTPAFPGQEGFVGATMGEPSVILRGTDDPAGAELLYSTVHGAGRVMSRTQAAGRMGNRAECTDRDCDYWVSWAQYRHEKERAGAGDRFTLCPRHPDGRMAKRRGRIKAGRIDFGAVQDELVSKGIELRGGAADEAPDAYKRLDAVLAAHGDTIEVLHRLTPIGVAMAPADTFDPYKD